MEDAGGLEAAQCGEEGGDSNTGALTVTQSQPGKNQGLEPVSPAPGVQGCCPQRSSHGPGSRLCRLSPCQRLCSEADLSPSGWVPVITPAPCPACTNVCTLTQSHTSTITHTHLHACMFSHVCTSGRSRSHTELSCLFPR